MEAWEDRHPRADTIACVSQVSKCINIHPSTSVFIDNSTHHPNIHPSIHPTPTTPTMKFSTPFLAVLSALPAFAANCNPERSAASVETYQRVAASVCGGPCGSSSKPCYIGNVYGWYVGNQKVHCWVSTPFFPLSPTPRTCSSD